MLENLEFYILDSTWPPLQYFLNGLVDSPLLSDFIACQSLVYIKCLYIDSIFLYTLVKFFFLFVVFWELYF